jgi:DNA polymerase III alpha subunit
MAPAHPRDGQPGGRAGMPAIGLTDHGVMYGAIHFYKACRGE